LSLVFSDIVTQIVIAKIAAWQRTDIAWLQCFINYGSDIEYNIVQKGGGYSFAVWQEHAC
jgi:hypothetical protein